MLKEDKIHNCLEENKNSQNILIKGDNLEVLKHLKNAYENQIKMIYIDPPYNTSNDGFVYNDDRKFTIEELSHLAGISLEESKRILDFTESNSNSHSAWLTFMYPRLYIARELLKEKASANIETALSKIGLDLMNLNLKSIMDTAGVLEQMGLKSASEIKNKAKADVAEQEKFGRTAAANFEAQTIKAEKEAEVNKTEAILNAQQEIEKKKAETNEPKSIE
jgi:hypothetical protein